jgi:hypothetical protein
MKLDLAAAGQSSAAAKVMVKVCARVVSRVEEQRVEEMAPRMLGRATARNQILVSGSETR